MAKTANTTLLEDLIDPQVIADEIDKKIIDNIRFAPLAVVDNTLEGRSGDELTLPSYDYVGDAVDVAEGEDIPVSKLSATTEKVKVAKIGKAVQYTDEALLSGNANSIAVESATQIIASVASGVENKFLTSMTDTAQLTSTIAATGNVVNGVIDGTMQFGEDVEGDKVLIVPPTLYSRLVKSGEWIANTDIGANILIRGSIGSVAGCQVLLSNRLKDKNVAFIAKPGALRLYMKRNTLVEFDRDKLDQTNYIIGSKIFAPYVYDKSKLVKLTLDA